MPKTTSTSVTAYYGAEEGQDHRSSPNFSAWDAPEGCTIKVTVEPVGNHPQPTFSIWEDLSWAQDKTWYSGIKNGSEFPPDYQNGKSGKHGLYIVTTDAFGTPTNEQYTVTVQFITE